MRTFLLSVFATTISCVAQCSVSISPSGSGRIIVNPFPPVDLLTTMRANPVFVNSTNMTANATCGTGNWRLLNCDDSRISTNTWATNLPWSCFIFGKGGSNASTIYVLNGGNPIPGQCDLTLITSRHAVTTWHTTQVIATNVQVWAQGGDGLWQSNYISGGQLINDDLQLVTFSNNWASSVVPAMVMPTNIPVYMKTANPNNPFLDVPVVEVRNNTREANGLLTLGVNTPPRMALESGINIANCPFSDTTVSGGDSSSPYFWLLGTNLVLVCSYGISGTQGTFVSDTNTLSGILAAIGTNQLRQPDLSGYLKYQ